MIRTEHNAHLYEACSVFGQGALEPQQPNDIAHIVVPRYERAHVHAIECWLFPSIIAYAADDVGWHTYLCAPALNLQQRSTRYCA